MVAGGVVADCQIECPVAVKISQVQINGPIAYLCHPGRLSRQRAITGVQVDPIGLAKVADRQVQKAVAVEIPPGKRLGLFGNTLYPMRGILNNAGYVEKELRRAVKAAHRQVQVAVAIHIAPGQGLRQPSGVDAPFLLHQLPTLVQVEFGRLSPESCRQVKVAVAVDISPGHAGHTPGFDQQLRHGIQANDINAGSLRRQSKLRRYPADRVSSLSGSV